MSNRGFSKFLLLLWKNYKLQIRHIRRTIVEFVFPHLFTLVLIILRYFVQSKKINAVTSFHEFNVHDASNTAIFGSNYILYAPENEATKEIIDLMEEDLKENLKSAAETMALTLPKYLTKVKAPKSTLNLFFALTLLHLNSSGLTDYKFVGYRSERELERDYKQNRQYAPKYVPTLVTKGMVLNNSNPVFASVIFDKLTKTIKYRIRFPSLPEKSSSPIAGLKATWLTQSLYPFFQLPSPRSAPVADEDDDIEAKQDPFNLDSKQRGGPPGYWRQGFLFFQALVDRAIMKSVANKSSNDSSVVDEYKIFLNRFPFPPYIKDRFILVLQQNLGLFLVLSFTFPTMNIARSVCLEKERRLKESMKVMGLPNWLHWTAWFVKDYSFHLIAVIIMTGMYKIPWFGTHLSILTYANGFLLCFFLAAYAFSTVTMGYFFSSMFSTAPAAATGTLILFWATYFAYFIVHPRYALLTKTEKFALSIFSNSAVCIGAQIVTVFEGTGAGIQWSTLARGASPEENMSLLDVILMLLFDGVVHLLLAIYIEAIHPGDYGIPLPWYFPFTKWYWFNEPRISEETQSKPLPQEDGEGGMSDENKNKYFEEEPDGNKGIEIKGLTKVFKKKVAVNNLTLNFYEDQVTALLGHNGAGKTTTMSMLTGLFPPTSGTAIVNGFDVRTDITDVRSSLGLCPQHDVLFDELTVEEHLFFFCTLKGHDQAYVLAEVERMLQALNLDYKRKAQTQTLSGGMKRRLSVGIALIGDSHVVLLDEPTSGMDPGARRGTWDLISQEKKGRTIVLSTHFMDEADILGDRIAIMAEGQLRCCGSSLFLKKKYGGGYHLIIVKLANCNVDKITQLLQKYIPELEVDQDIGAELSYSLPEEKSEIFADIFEELEGNKEALGIESYGCSITQMEEVFIRVGRQVEEELKAMRKSNRLENREGNHGGGDQDKKSKVGDDDHAQQQQQQHQPPKAETKKKGDEAKESHEPPASPSMKHLEEEGKGEQEEESIKNDDSSTIVSMPEAPALLKVNRGPILLVQQFYAMLVKKCLYAKRNIILLIAHMSPPVIFLVLTSIMLKTIPDLSVSNERKIELSHYHLTGQTVTTISCLHNKAICKSYESATKGDSKVKYVGNFPDFIVKKSQENLPGVTYHYIVALETKEENNGTKLKGYFNNQPFHSPPLALNLISTAILRSITRDSEYTIKMSNHPLPLTAIESVENLFYAQQVGFSIGFSTAIGMGYVAASFVVFLIKERVSKSKHLQFLSGCKFIIFWMVHFLVDFFIYAMACIVVLIVLVGFQTRDFSERTLLPKVFYILLTYGFAQLPMVYLGSFLFSTPSTAYIMIGFVNFFTGLACMLVNTVLRLDSLGLVHLAEKLDLFFMFFPNYNVGNCLQLLSLNKQLHETCPKVGSFLPTLCRTLGDEAKSSFHCCIHYPRGTFDWEWPGVGKYIFVSVLTGTIGFAILFIVESKIVLSMTQYFKTRKIKRNSIFNEDPYAIEDTDVAEENQRIRETDLNQLFKVDTMVLKDLTKLYGNFLAVERLCLGVRPGECFGLLGINGAGKTTTFKMLSGDITISFGDAYIRGKSVKSHIKKVQRLLGYCPQFDALIPEMTGRETIRMFARLRGIPEKKIDGVIERLGKVLLFTEHMDKPCGTYSGGNKRKLSTAIALTGDPPIVFLDEPTSGMDPVARRHLWNAVNHVVRVNGTSVVLTSHSMEECEALCTRLAIMVNGKFRCLGSTQHLKTKFGNGYTLTAQIKQPHHKSVVISRSSLEIGRRSSSASSPPQQWELDLIPFRTFIEETFKGSCHIKDMHPGYIHYHINGESHTWAEMFKTMEEAKKQFPIQAYSVGQTTLEQIFLNFTKAQTAED